MGRTFNLVFWNVRGLGDQTKCDNVLAELLSANPSIVLLQETKLSSPPSSKFSPSSLVASNPTVS